MRRAARVDANHAAIVAALRAIGCSVQSLASLGGGVPDLLVGRAGRNYLLEVKDGNKPATKRTLTPDERRWRDCWRGQMAVVECAETAIAEVGNASGLRSPDRPRAGDKQDRVVGRQSQEDA